MPGKQKPKIGLTWYRIPLVSKSDSYSNVWCYTAAVHHGELFERLFQVLVLPLFTGEQQSCSRGGVLKTYSDVARLGLLLIAVVIDYLRVLERRLVLQDVGSKRSPIVRLFGNRQKEENTYDIRNVAVGVDQRRFRLNRRSTKQQNARAW